ncbi:MAG: family 20 glycosylhydrolase, partial [Alistipes sp.]|nr:family 20 glycosylhydrolase [Alistipes sp.]
MRIAKFFVAVVALILVVGSAYADNGIIPRPVEFEKRNGVFTILTTTKITHSVELRSSAKYLAEYLPLEVQQTNEAAKGNIVLRVNKNLASEAYTLEVGDGGIIIEGGSNAGVFYGVETLLQLLPAKVYSKQMELPVMLGACRVADEPKFEYRGFMLDVTRTWVDVDGVKHYIENLAHHK